MNVCLVALDYYGWGQRSGFARATRTLGRELVRHGIRVTAVVPQAQGQPERASADGVEVFSFAPARPGQAYRWLREIDADIYHSVEPSLLTHIAARARPARGHVVTVLDPAIEAQCVGVGEEPRTSPSLRVARRLYRQGRRVRRAVRAADHCFVGARHLGERVASLFGLAEAPSFIPLPVHVPEAVSKAETPTVCMLERWDRERHPERFFQLAERFPNVNFVAAGRADSGRVTEEVRRAWAHLPNLELRPPLDPFTRAYDSLLAESWILVNPAETTGLPAAFLDAAARGTALLSHSDPDDFASNFGVRAGDEGFAPGLEALLKDDYWQKRGVLGRDYVARTFEAGRSVQLHLDAYRAIAEGKPATTPDLPAAMDLTL